MNTLESIGLRPAFFIPLIIIAVFAIPAALMLKRGYRIRSTDRRRGKASYDLGGEGWLGFGWGFAIVAACTFVVAAISYIPYDFKYAHIYRVSGEVQSVSNVFEDASGSLTGTPIVQLDSLPIAIESDNARLVNLVGKEVTLTCTLNWRYAAADRLVCDIYEVKS